MLRKVSVGLFLVLAACGNAKLIQRTQTGGIYELQGDRAKAMEQAAAEMSAHCGGPGSWSIVQEGEEAVGTTTVHTEDTATDTKTSRRGRRSSTDSSTVATTETRTATAYRIHYQCNSAGAPPPAGDMPPAAGDQPPPPPAEGGY